MVDMDLFDRKILSVLKDRTPREFQKILSRIEFSYNILMLHLAHLVDQGLMLERKKPQQSLGSLVDPYKGLVVLSFEKLGR